MTLDGEIVVPEGVRAEMARLARKRRSLQMYLAVHFGELFAQADAQGNDYVVLTPSGNGSEVPNATFFPAKKDMRDFAGQQDVFACGYRRSPDVVFML